MTIHQHISELVENFFNKNPLPAGYAHVVYSTNDRHSGYCRTRTLIVFRGDRPINRIIAEKRGEIAYPLPLNPGKKSPTTMAVCKAVLEEVSQ